MKVKLAIHRPTCPTRGMRKRAFLMYITPLESDFRIEKYKYRHRGWSNNGQWAMGTRHGLRRARGQLPNKRIILHLHFFKTRNRGKPLGFVMNSAFYHQPANSELLPNNNNNSYWAIISLPLHFAFCPFYFFCPGVYLRD